MLVIMEDAQLPNRKRYSQVIQKKSAIEGCGQQLWGFFVVVIVLRHFWWREVATMRGVWQGITPGDKCRSPLGPTTTFNCEQGSNCTSSNVLSRRRNKRNRF